MPEHKPETLRCEMKLLYPEKRGDEYGPNGTHLRVEMNNGVVFVEGVYPDYDNPPIVEYDQESVRASGGIRVVFSFDRNGYIIMQQVERWFEASGDYELDDEWSEVGFFPAFNRVEKDPVKAKEET